MTDLKSLESELHQLSYQVSGLRDLVEQLASPTVINTRIYYLNAKVISKTEDVLNTDGKVKAIKHLRTELQPMVLLPLRDAKRVVDQIQSGTVEFDSSGQNYRIFRNV